MALEPFSTGADKSGTSGVEGYAAGTGPAGSSRGGLNPSFGRSSRDLASDSGPAAAPQGLWSSTADTNADTTDANTAAGAGFDTDPNKRARPGESLPREDGRKNNPDVDPDTRLGLRPATAGMVAPNVPTYPVSDAATRAATGAVGGVIGAAVVVVLADLLHWVGLIPATPSVAAASRLLDGRGGPLLIFVAAAFGSVIAGAMWGAVFGLLVRRPTILKGMAFGLVPALFQWLVLSPLLGEGLFFRRLGFGAGVGLPLLFNVLIFGSILGYYCGRKLCPPYTGAVDPDLTSAVPNP